MSGALLIGEMWTSWPHSPPNPRPPSSNPPKGPHIDSSFTRALCSWLLSAQDLLPADSTAATADRTHLGDGGELNELALGPPVSGGVDEAGGAGGKLDRDFEELVRANEGGGGVVV